MRVNVRLFAALAEAAGCRECEFDLPTGSTGEDLLQAVQSRFGLAESFHRHVRLAVNESYVPWDRELRDGDDAALIPPVSGGAPDPAVEVTHAAIDVPSWMARVQHPGAGAVVVFTGTVRELTGDRRTVALRYEAYESMAKREMARVAQQAARRWDGVRMAIVHRLGELRPEEISVAVVASSPHRAEAFAAARYGIDTVKMRVPIWKKEVWDDGSAWVGWPEGTANWAGPPRDGGDSG